LLWGEPILAPIIYVVDGEELPGGFDLLDLDITVAFAKQKPSIDSSNFTDIAALFYLE